MDNFRKYNTGNRRPGSAVDGFVGRSQGIGSSRPHAKPQQPMIQPPTPRLDTFRKTDGFRPAAQPLLKPTAAQAKAAHAAPRLDSTIDMSLPQTKGKTKKSRKKLPLTKKQKIKRSMMVFTVLIVLGTGLFIGKSFLLARNIFKGGGGAAALQANVDPAKLNGEGDGRVNIMMLGKGGDGHEAPDLTDTLMVASIDPIQNEAALLGIPRDFWVENEYGETKINAVYANAKYAVDSDDKKAEAAGLEAIEKTIEDSMGIPIHYYVMVDFEAFKQAIDAVGGVDIDVKSPVYDRMHANGRPYILDIKTGPHHFDGLKGLMYARSRYTSPRGDFDRSQRQREILIALKEKTLTAGTFSNPRKVSQLMSAFGSRLQTNMTMNEMLRLYEIGKNIPSDKVASLGLADPPNVLVQTANVNGQSVVVPKAGNDDYSAIRSFVRNALKDAFLKKEDATIAVFNGTTTAGLASTKADELKSYGYNISKVANAPAQNYTQTVLVDLTNGQKKYTKGYLEKRFNVTAVTTVPAGIDNSDGAEFVIILGPDATR